jgi:hypothetical protein
MINKKDKLSKDELNIKNSKDCVLQLENGPNKQIYYLFDLLIDILF